MIEYTDDPASIGVDALSGFFVGWPSAPSAAQHLAVLRGSHRVVLAVDSDTGQVVGFVNMISDGVLTAFIPWLEVLPDWQDKGIGTELMNRILAGTEQFYSVDLLCDRELLPYYERLGMREVAGAAIRHPSALRGDVPQA
jgi:predicted N-acetyltransferase YhbS